MVTKLVSSKPWVDRNSRKALVHRINENHLDTCFLQPIESHTLVALPGAGNAEDNEQCSMGTQSTRELELIHPKEEEKTM